MSAVSSSINLDTYRRIRAGEALTYVLSPRSLWSLTGPDARRYLNGQITNDVAGLSDGQGCYAAVCTAKGRMEGDLFVSVSGADFYLDAAASLHESLGARLEKYLIADDAVFEDISEQWTLSHVFGASAPAPAEEGFVIARARYGVPGHDIWTSGTEATVVGGRVEADVIETLRLEQGLPLWGAELTPNTLPPEGGAHLLDAISYTKGCYVGQETIARLKSVGHVNRTLVFLRSETSAFPEPGAKLTKDDREVGALTSSGLSPELNRGIALGYVQRALAAEGTMLEAGGQKMIVTAPLSPKNSL